MTEVSEAALAVGEVTYARSRTVPAGQVLDQQPDAGARVPSGSAVGMQVSLGAEQLTVPDVVGLEQADAQDRIEQAGFALGAVRDTTSDQVEAGEVDRQLPLAGKQALPGTPIDVDVARGKVNDPPEITSSPGPAHTTGGEPYAYDATATDPDDDDLSWMLQAGPEGAAVDPGTGELRWDAGADDAGAHDLVVRVEDGRGGLDTQSFTVTVAVPNRAPDADDDVLTATTGSPRAIEAAELLSNDSDPDGDPLTIASFTQPQTGRVTRQGDGLTYTPNAPTSPDQVLPDVELTRVQPVTITSSVETQPALPLERLSDDSTQGDWFAVNSARAPITLTFAFDVDVALRRVDLFGSRQFGEQGYDVRALTVRALDDAGAVLFEAPGLAPEADATSGDGADADSSFDLLPLNGGAPVAGVRTVEVVITEVGSRNYPGLSEIDLHGDAPAALLAPQLEWEVTDAAAQTVPLVADLDGDGTPEVVYNTLTAQLRARDGATGAVVWTRTDAEEYGTPAIGDLTDDEGLEIAYVGDDARFVRLADAAGNLLGQFDTGLALAESNLTLADVDGDGRPEIVAAGSDNTSVLDVDAESGALSQRWTDAAGCARNDPWNYCTPVVVDVDVDGSLEVVRGHRIVNAATGRLESASSRHPQGFVAVANFDDDPQGEIVVVSRGTLTILNHDLSTFWGPVPLAVGSTASPQPGNGGLPVVADFDGDGRPEIGVAGAQVYAVYDPDVVLDDDSATEDAVLWKSPIDDSSSSSTGSTVFDFDGDGTAEVVYADQEFVRIYAGPTGDVRWSRPNGSNTRSEAPVVADVDGDGEAEIVVAAERATTVSGSSYPAGVRVFGSPGNNWVSTRAIWNQHAYDVTNVDADGTIPAVPAVNWLTAGLNSFRQQHLPTDDPDRLDRFTYTVSDGEATSAPATVAVDVLALQNDPVITCGPPATVTLGFPVTGRICADDVDGDEVTFVSELSCEVTANPHGNDNPWLAGMPVGTQLPGDEVLAADDPQFNPDADPWTTPDGNEAPEQVFFPCGLVPGQVLEFEATGASQFSGPPPTSPTDGSSAYTHPCNFQLASLTSPIDALLGVFLSDAQPGDPGTSACDAGAQSGLDFATPESRDFTGLEPLVQQPFFIGDGATSGGARHQVRVPDGATRLFLGSMDGFGWYNNTGDFDVTITTAATDETFTIDPDVGTFDWRPTQPGVYELVVLVTDTSGRQVRRSFPMRVVAPAIVPDVVGDEEAAAVDAVADADLAVGDVDRRSSTDVPAGQVLEQFPPADAAAEPGSRVDLVVSSGASPADIDADDDGFSPNAGDCNDADETVHPDADEIDNDGVDSDCDGEDGGLDVQKVGINGSDASLVVGRTRPYTAQALLGDGRVVDITDLATFDVVDDATASVAGRTVTGLAPGATGVTASFAGRTATKPLTVVDGVAADELPPVAEVTAPSPGDKLGTEVVVTGRATDANLTGWSLVVLDSAGTQLLQVAEGTAPVDGGELGRLAGSTLPSGALTLRLDVEDGGGNVTRIDVPVVVEEGPQVGAFTVSFIDAAVPVSGLALTATRAYDSRDVRVGDFGAGWRLELSGLELSATPEQGLGWDLAPGRFGSTALLPTDEHAVVVRAPDGGNEVFDFAPSPSAATFQQLQFTQARYVPRSGTRGTLVPRGNSNLLVLGSADGVELVDDSTLRAYEPAGFVYTAPDGVVYTVDADGDVERVREPNGNAVAVTGSGIQHSAGRSLVFERDQLGRITAIVDPEGGRQSYSYDARGDLVSHTDPEGHKTRFRYQAGHRLVEVVDPLGRSGARTEYDAAGRVVATTSAVGRRVEFTHDVSGQREVVSDADGSRTELAYDADGNVVEVVDALGGVTRSTYDADGNRLTLTDPLGRTETRTYGAAGRVLTITDDTGATQSMTYGPRDRLTSRTSAVGDTTSYAYDAAGNLLTVTESDGVVMEANSYDGSGNLLTQTDVSGATTTHTYDEAGNRTSTTDPTGAAMLVQHDARGIPTKRTDPLGREFAVVTDARGLVTSATGPTGLTTTVALDELGQTTGVEDAAGDRIDLTLDAAGNVVEQIDALAGTTRITYTATGRQETVVDADGGTTRYSYDALGRVVTVTDATGAVTTTGYDAVGQVVSVTDPVGATTTYAYDDAGRRTTATGAEGGVTRYGWDDAGNLLVVTDPIGGVTTHTYDDQRRRTSTTWPDGTTESTDHDDAARVTEATATDGGVTRYTHDAAGRIAEVTDPAGGTTSATYDAAGNVTSVTDAEGRTTRYRYDDLDRVVETLFPSGVRETTQYDEASRPVRSTDRNGGVTQRTFGAGGRLASEAWPDGSFVTHTYDATGARVSSVDPTGRTTYERDLLDRLVALTRPDGSRVSYTRDAVGNRDSVTAVPGSGQPGVTSTFDHDRSGRMTGVTDHGGRTTSFSYDAAGRPVLVERPNGLDTTTSYDPRHRVTQLEHRTPAGVVERFGYERTVAGDPSAVTSLDGSRSEFGYDTLRRLVSEAHLAPGGSVEQSQQYTYDDVGNRLSSTDASGTTTAYAYDVDDALLTAGAVSHAYDANGAQIGRTEDGATTAFGYSPRGLLSAASVPGHGTTSYQYGADRARLSRTGPDGETRFAVDPLAETGVAEVLAEHDPSGQLQAAYTWGPELVGEDRAGALSFFAADELASVRVVTDATGAVVGGSDHLAFGETRNAGPLATTYGFAGQRWDAESGLYHLRARQYDPSAGRFTSVDAETGSLVDPMTRQPYLYARAAPLTWVDPSGNFETIASLTLGAATVSALIAGVTGYFMAPYGGTKAVMRGLISAGLAFVATYVFAAGVSASIALGVIILTKAVVALGLGVLGSIAASIALTGAVTSFIVLPLVIAIKAVLDIAVNCLVGAWEGEPCFAPAQGGASVGGSLVAAFLPVKARKAFEYLWEFVLGVSQDYAAGEATALQKGEQTASSKTRALYMDLWPDSFPEFFPSPMPPPGAPDSFQPVA